MSLLIKKKFNSYILIHFSHGVFFFLNWTPFNGSLSLKLRGYDIIKLGNILPQTIAFFYF